MKSRPLSASSIKTFLQCSLKYYYRYEDKQPRFEDSSDALAFGTAVHAALEYMHEVVYASGKRPSKQVYDDVLRVFTDAAAEAGLADLSLYEEGKEIMLRRLDLVDPEEKIVGLELKFNLTTDKGTPFLGSIDKLVELDPETAVIIDYKTSRTAISQDEADHDIQLSMYDLAVSLMYPQYKTIVSALDYLRLPEVVTHRTPEQRVDFINFLDSVYSTILKTEQKDIKANLNTFCSWCSFKQFCPDFADVIKNPNLQFPVMGEMADKDLVAAWEEISTVRRIVDNYQRKLKTEVHMRYNKDGNIKGGEKQLYKSQSTMMSYDTKTVFNVVGPEDYVKMSNISKRAVDKYILENPDKADYLKENASFSFNSPTFKLKKID